MKYCRQCGKELYDEDVVCPECNTIVGSGKAFCATCGKPVNGEENCPHCGAVNLSSETSTYDVEQRQEDKPASCPHCGETVAPGQRFCPKCGKLLFVPSKDLTYVYNKKKLKVFLISFFSSLVLIATIVFCVIKFNANPAKIGYNYALQEIVKKTEAKGGGAFSIEVTECNYIYLAKYPLTEEEKEQAKIEPIIGKYYYYITYEVTYVSNGATNVGKGYYEWKEDQTSVTEIKITEYKSAENQIKMDGEYGSLV